MRVLFLARLYKPHVGGIERHLDELSSILAKKGHDITIVVGKHEKNLASEEINGKARILRIWYPEIKVLGLIVVWFKLIRLIGLFKSADVVHIHDVFIWYFPLKFIIPRKRVYMTFHGYPDYPIPKMAIVNQKLAEKLTRGNLVIGKFINKWFNTKADLVSYGAVDISKFKLSKRKKFKYDAVFASRLDKHTGILTYLDTIKIFKKQGIDFKLLVLGDGEYKNEADKLATALGWVDDPSKYFDQCRWAFVNRYLAILEAFASKKLVFAVYDNPVKKDYLFMTPFRKWMVIEKNPKRLAERILYYTSNPDKAKNKVNDAYLWARKQTWEDMVDNYITLWSC